jgi:serine/threonine-protein kinase
MTAAPVNPGDVLGGKYRVVRTLGAGGIGVVVEAVHTQLERQVAIKFLLPEANSNPQIVARFTREARASARLKGEHVTQVLDVGAMEDGSPYMVMEHLAGTDLGQLLSECGRLSVADAVDYVLQAIEALAEAHAAHIVHRDLKPANLFLTRTADGEPLVKVLDFGISKALDPDKSESGLSLTQSATMIGTPLYMSPEQMRDARHVDVRTDIWALGAILYELIAGRPPFLASSLAELCVKVMQDDPAPLSRVRPDVPQDLAAIIDRCLCKQRTGRYADVGELAAALARFGGMLSHSRVTRVSRLLGRSGERARSADEVPPTQAPPEEANDEFAATPPGQGRPLPGRGGWPMSSTARAWGKDSEALTRPFYRRASWIALGLLLVAGLGFGSWIVFKPAVVTATGSATASASSLPSALLSPPAESPKPSPRIEPMPSAAVSAEVARPASPPKPVRTTRPAPAAAPPAPSPVASAATPRPSQPGRDRLLNDRE